MGEPAGVHHHVAIQRRGGATAVARSLMAAQAAERPSVLSFEAAEPASAQPPSTDRLVDAGALARQVRPGWILHVHASLDWLTLLEGMRDVPRPLVVTAHDCSLLTGGCVYPVFCSHYHQSCMDPCPRDYPESASNRALKQELVDAVSPLLVSPSAWLAGQLRERWPGLAVKVVPNGVPSREPMDKAAARRRFAITPEARVGLFLAHGGAGAVYKGGDRIRSILRGVAARVPGFLGVVAGGGEPGLADGVLTLPYLEDDALLAVLAASDALIYPSLADNHPLVILEAMAAGLPVAGYAAGGIVEQVAQDRTGVLVPVKDEQALVGAASSLLADQARLRNMGEAARSRAAKHFSLERMAAGYAKAYARAAGGWQNV